MNLSHVPEADRPAQEALESDYDPWAGQDIEAWRARTNRSRTPTGRQSAAASPDDASAAATPPNAAKPKASTPPTSAKPAKSKPTKPSHS